MTGDVTDVIAARTGAPERLAPMVAWSAVAHAVLILLLLAAPAPRSGDEDRTVMTISLGAPGERTGGMTPMGGRAVQEAAPAPPIRRADPAPARPEMTLPDPRPARPQPERPRPQQAPADARSRTAARGEEVVAGSTRTDTQVRGQGFGLSGGGGLAGSSVEVDVANFCCPAYLEQMMAIIQRNWQQNHGVAGSTTVRFTVLRDGAIAQPQVERTSGFQILDTSAMRAVQLARLPPLPAEFTNPNLTVHIRFEYQR